MVDQKKSVGTHIPTAQDKPYHVSGGTTTDCPTCQGGQRRCYNKQFYYSYSDGTTHGGTTMGSCENCGGQQIYNQGCFSRVYECSVCQYTLRPWFCSSCANLSSYNTIVVSHRFYSCSTCNGTREVTQLCSHDKTEAHKYCGHSGFYSEHTVRHMTKINRNWKFFLKL